MTKNIYTYKNATITYIHNTIDVNKPTLVCLHGFLEHKGIFNFLFEDTYFKSYNLIAIDLLGHNESDTIGYIHTMEDQANMVYGLLTQLNIYKANILGHSLGGYVSLAFLTLYPKMVNKICLLNSSTKADSEEKKINRLRGIELVKKNSSIFIQLAISNLFDEKTRLKYEQEINDLKQIALKNNANSLIANMRGMMERPDTSYLLCNSNIFFIAGSSDQIIPMQEIKDEAVPNNNSLFELNGYHMLWLEQPESIKKILKENL
jgi:pimeloyl-ACP methyl ester carboxylesterase